jgi:hypothetical protein
MTDEELADNYLSNPSRMDLSKILKNCTKSEYRIRKVQNTLALGPVHKFCSMMDQSRGMFVSDFVADPKSTLETFNSLSVTPAALLAVIARELKDAFKDINAIKLSVAETVDVTGTINVQDTATVITGGFRRHVLGKNGHRYGPKVNGSAEHVG